MAVQLPCPHCGELLSKPWWACMPGPSYHGPDFTCKACGKASWFPKSERVLGLLMGMLAGGAGVLIVNGLVAPAKPHLLLWLSALIVPCWLISAMVCARSDHLIKKLLGPEWKDLR